MPRHAPPWRQLTKRPLRRRGESIGRGGLDSAKKKIDVQWTAPDSVMSRLLEKPGYAQTRYQGNRVIFKALEHTMYLVGKRAAVQRDSAMLVGDTILFNDSTNLVIARGDTLLLRDPSQGQDDIIALGSIRYDMNNRRGVVRNVTTSVESGQRWIVHGRVAAFKGDTSGTGGAAFYARDGWLTSCEDLTPHYHFAAREMKLISKNVMVARPAVLYIADIPVMWLPFVFQDMRAGRRSGIIPPRLGFNQIFRQSPFLRRTVEDIGYYFALTDYVDAQVSMDWRSRARETAQDPGWMRLNGELRYRWLNRFLQGNLAVSQNSLSSGSKNTALSWSHTQEFSSRTRFSTNINYVTNTQVQRRTTINPMQALATISSQANLTRQQGPLSINLGGTQRQYPGRDQVDRDFPSLNIASKPLTMGEWFVITPTFAYSNSQRLNLDAVGDFTWRYLDGGSGLDSTRLRRDSRNTSLTLGTPFKVFDFQVQSSFRFTDVANDFPEIKTLPDPNDPTQSIDRVYARTYKSTADFEFSVGLPQFFKGTWNLDRKSTRLNSSHRP